MGHMVSTENANELHEFAKALDLKREWYQTPGYGERHAHYDLTTTRAKNRAKKKGAKEVHPFELVKKAWWGRNPKPREKLSRSVTKSMNKRNKTKRFQGYFYSDKNKKEFFYRSTYELKALMKLESKKNILSYEMEYFKIKYKFGGTNRIYIPDFWIIMKKGKEYILEVKAKWLVLDPLNVAKIKAAKDFCQKNNMKFILWTEKTLGGAYYDRKGKYHMSSGK